jgi:hypothetical protein
MRYFLASVLILLFLACNKDNLSKDATLLGMEITEINRQGISADTTFVDQTNHLVSIMLEQDIPADSFPVTLKALCKLPAGASVSIDPVAGITFNEMDQPESISVTAEDGTHVVFTVLLRGTQIPNSGFEDWYSASGLNGQNYLEPGKSEESTVWATANSGTSIYAVYGTIPVVSNDNTIAHIVTGETSSIPITSGTLFTGKFDINGAISNPTDPKKATKFGIPFTLRPAGMKFKYSFVPGTRYIQGTLKNPNNIFGGFNITDLVGQDKFTAYAILEHRTDANITEVGRLDFVSSTLQNELTEIEIPFNYSSSLKPTHITVVFASSKDGDLFTGAVGSTLEVDDLELVYP